MKNKFKVGDIVLINLLKEDISKSNPRTKLYLNRGMKEYNKKICKITQVNKPFTAIDNHHSYRLDIDEESWLWISDWLVRV